MAAPHDAQTPPAPLGTLEPHLAYLQRGFIAVQ
jgi:hypothetical protein